MFRPRLRPSHFSLLAASGALLCGGLACTTDPADTNQDDSPAQSDESTTDDTQSPEAGPSETGDVPTLPLDESAALVGTFLVVLQAEQPNAVAATRFSGSVGDAPQPELTVWELATRDEVTGCELLTPRTPSCTPNCPVEAACVEDATCVNYPTKHSVGDITVFGLQTTDGVSEFTVKPQKPKLDYLKPSSVTLLYPPAPEGDVVRLVSTGGDFSPLDILTTAIAPLVLTSPEPLDLSPDAPLSLSWTPAAAGDSRIQVKVDVSHHGGAKGKILCDVPDTGSLEIPGSLNQALIELGVAGYPNVELTRIARGIGNVEAGRVELQIISLDDRQLSIPGLVSCDKDDQCPSGQKCLVTRSCG